MPTFDESWSGRLRIIGELERPDHWHLTADDNCAFFGEYTARAGWGHSSTNQLILNLKKKPELAGTQQYAYKTQAIRDIATALKANLDPAAFPGLVVTPVPPSKAPGATGYDDRMARVARLIDPAIDVREVLVTAVERDAMHAQNAHRDPQALRDSLAFRPELIASPPRQVLLLDDVVTTGCSFRVCKRMIGEIWPDAQVYGVFVARRVIDRGTDFDALEWD
ncbi:hypothetical protein BH10PSE1_BH10PSE1_24310 [soil metagenome]